MKTDDAKTIPAMGETSLTVTLDGELASGLSTFLSRNPEMPAPAEAVRHILRLWLTENGYDGVHEDDGTRPEALNASNDD